MTDSFARVREGMHVLDATGQNIGTVDLVKAGDPAAVTTEGQKAASAPAGVFALGQGGSDEPDVPPSLAERLLRTGFVRISAKGLFERDLYVSAEQVTAVDDDTVTVDAIRDELIREG